MNRRYEPKSLVAIWFLLAFGCLFTTYSYGADWKYVGAGPVKEETSLTFFDQHSIEYLSSGLVHVWTESIPLYHIQKIFDENKHDIVERSANKVVAHYIPPLCHVDTKIDYNSSIDIIAWEEIANDPQVKPQAAVLFEIDCKRSQLRSLSTAVYDTNGGLIGKSEKEKSFQYTSPESTGDWLRQIVCQASNVRNTEKQTQYELQERCGVSCEHWARQHSEVINYKAHYNSKANKCFVLATLSPVKADEGWTSYEMLYVVNEHAALGQITVRHYNPDVIICIIRGNTYEGDEGREKWSAFVKDMMED